MIINSIKSSKLTRKKKPHLVFSITIILLLSALATPTTARTWHIKPNGTGDAPTIQAGIDSASAGDSILVAVGKYYDTRQVLVDGTLKKVNVHLYKNVKVIGEGGGSKTMINAYQSDIGIYIESVDSSAAVKNFIIHTSYQGYMCYDTALVVPPDAPAGIECRSGSPTVTHNSIRFNDVGVRLFDSDAYIQNNQIYHSLVNIMCGDGSNAVISNNELHDGKRLIECDASSPTIDNNHLRNGCEGIRTKNGAAPLITNNTIHFLYSWAVVCKAGFIFENNWISGSATGIRFEDCVGSSTTRILKNNLFYNNIIAVEIVSLENAQIENNTIDANDFGVYCESGRNITTRNNIITRPSFGISCCPACSLVIQCNDIFDADVARYDGSCPDLTGLDGNISLDPEFCGLYDSGYYYLQEDSPCASGNHPDMESCGLIGAFDVKCGLVSVEDTSFGRIKALFKRLPPR